MSYFKHTNTIWVISMLTLIISCSVSDATRYFLCTVFRLHCIYHFLKFSLNILPKLRGFFSPKNKKKKLHFSYWILKDKKIKLLNTTSFLLMIIFLKKPFYKVTSWGWDSVHVMGRMSCVCYAKSELWF